MLTNIIFMHIILNMKHTSIYLTSPLRRARHLLTLWLLSLCLVPASGFCAWEKFAPSVPSAETILDLASCQNAPDCFYASTAHQIFKNEKNAWLPLFTLASSGDSIVRIHTFPASPGLWIQTQKSIFLFDLLSNKPAQIYTTSAADKFPLSFLVETKNLWVGTLSGLWNSKDSGKTWQKRSDLADHQLVSLIAGSGSDLFFSANGSWMKSENNRPRNLLRLFRFEDQVEDLDVTTTNTREENIQTAPPVSFSDYLKTSRMHYLASLQGVFKSADGITWTQLSNSGFRSTAVSRILWDEKNSELLAVTKHGVFVFDEKNQRWKSKNDGLAKLDARAILLLPNSEIFMVTNSDGLWTWKNASLGKSISPEQAFLFNKLVSLEPSARDIHKHVIKYSDTNNAKIKRWHAESRLASLMPNLSLGKDWGVSNNVDLDRAGTSDPDRFINGPWNKDRGTDLDLSWDLGDFIFSTSQTSIDSRAKLMVDLRNDLLAEATRLFYERRRLQAEMLQDRARDEKTHLDRLLRVDELTSLLDALTDGYLSKRLETIYKSTPAFETLWRLENKNHKEAF